MKMRHVCLRRLRPSPAIVIACVALAVALAPASYATVSQLLPDGSVGTSQLKDNAVTSNKVRDFSLRRWDFKQSDFPRVPSAEGRLLGKMTPREASVTVPAGPVAGNGLYATRAVQIRCQPGERAISGGTSWLNDVNQEELITVYSKPLIENGKAVGWRARGGSDEKENHVFSVEVLCVSQ
jgi:hypothetical protein